MWINCCWPFHPHTLPILLCIYKTAKEIASIRIPLLAFNGGAQKEGRIVSELFVSVSLKDAEELYDQGMDVVASDRRPTGTCGHHLARLFHHD